MRWRMTQRCQMHMLQPIVVAVAMMNSSCPTSWTVEMGCATSLAFKAVHGFCGSKSVSHSSTEMRLDCDTAKIATRKPSCVVAA